MYWYFVTFSCLKGRVRAWGNSEIPLRTRIRSIKDVWVLQAVLDRRFQGDCLITNYQFLRVDKINNDDLLAELCLAERVAQALEERHYESVSRM